MSATEDAAFAAFVDDMEAEYGDYTDDTTSIRGVQPMRRNRNRSTFAVECDICGAILRNRTAAAHAQQHDPRQSYREVSRTSRA